ncbi:hypothetical protein [Aliikangiella coralliicola]|uniref:Uncharacterized protein n=1 Tax=Aliikangiella coralliicola TaxID=2592383 RepID=A0A545UGH3_9GAMM|nr:hypothetical protein [Aliikangiella coralliicola]TQV88571.1 hypothetical protein FLL46_08620 [Aliikangiella coralliicola]
MEKSFIPNSYEEWRHCITVECGLELTHDFIEKRIESLQNTNEHYTQQFLRLYGQQHYQKVISWFIQARKSV